MEKDNFEILNHVFGKLIQDQAETELRREKKVWQEISFPITFAEILERLTKDELIRIVKYYNLKNLSALKKKDLIVQLVKILPSKVQPEIMALDDERYSLIKDFIKNDTSTVIDAKTLENEEVNYWRTTGLIYTGTWKNTQILLMPEEIRKAFQALDQQMLQKVVHRNTEWIFLTQGMLYYYGVLGFQQIVTQLEKLTGVKPDYLELHQVLWQAKDYYELIKINSYGYWASSDVKDIEKINQEHLTRPDLDFHKFSKSRLFKAGQLNYHDDSPAFRRFADFLFSAYKMTKEDAQEMAEECQRIIKQDLRPSAVFQFLQTRIESPSFEAVQELTKEVVELSNHTRQWLIKGYTPEELMAGERKFLNPLPSLPFMDSLPHPFAVPIAQPPAGFQTLQQATSKNKLVDMKTRKKVGRNDPCPCGSGKKFKHCCGKENV